MKYIARVVLDNFQSHVHSEFTFGPGLNVIVGPSDNGKSAVLRAINWVLYNEPKGTGHVRIGTRECRVAVTMSDGAEIAREIQLTKGGTITINRYTVTFPGGEPQSFEGFAHNMPAEIAQAHGMPTVLLDTDKRINLHIGKQLAGPFLMGDTTGSFRAKAIGRLLGVHVVDQAVRNTQTDAKRAKTEVSRQDKEVQRLETELAAFADIPAQERRTAEVERLLREADTLQAEIDQLKAARDHLAQIEQREADLQAIIDRNSKAREALVPISQSLAEAAELSSLVRIRDRHQQIAADIERAEATIRRHQGARKALAIHEEAGKLQADLKELRRIQATRDHVLADWSAKKVEIKRHRLAPEIVKSAESALMEAEDLQRLRKAQAALQGIDQAMAQAQRTIRQSASKARAVDAIAEAEVIKRDLDALNDKRAGLLRLDTAIQAKGNEIVRFTETKRSAAERFASALQEAGMCPWCLQAISGDIAAGIAHSLIHGEVHAHAG